MSKNTDKNIKNIIRSYVIPKIVAIRVNFHAIIDALFNRKITFTGDATGTVNINDITEKGKLEISLEIADDSHTHTTDQIIGSTTPTPNTIVQRNSEGSVIGSGNVSGSTGYKLADGRDLSELFMKKDYIPYSVNTVINGSGNYTQLGTLSFSIDSNQLITLSYNKANFCPVYTGSGVHKDGC